MTRSIDALRFIRRLYCLDDNLQLLKGSSAEVRGCPQSNPAQFVAENPGAVPRDRLRPSPVRLLSPPGRKAEAGRTG